MKVPDEAARSAGRDRDSASDAEARRWAREMRDALEAGRVPDDAEALAARLAEERAKKTTPR